MFISNFRENLYKKANLNKNLKQKARDEKLNARTQKKTLLDLVRRGIPKDLSDEEDSSDVLTPRTLRYDVFVKSKLIQNQRF